MEIIGNMSDINKYLSETKQIIDKINQQDIYKMWETLHNLKGRLFIIGVGGSAANALHAVNDFRKMRGIEAYTPMDNIFEYSANINDFGYELSFKKSLITSKLNSNDCILVLSVGGGNEKTSYNIVRALEYARSINVKIIGIVSRDGGYTAKVTDVCIIIPIINENNITPHAEELQSIILHLLVTI